MTPTINPITITSLVVSFFHLDFLSTFNALQRQQISLSLMNPNPLHCHVKIAV